MGGFFVAKTCCLCSPQSLLALHAFMCQASIGGGEREKPLYNKPKFVFFLYMYIIFSLYKEGVEKWFWKLKLVLH